MNGKTQKNLPYPGHSNLLAYKLNSSNEDDEHLIETVHLKPIMLSDVCNLNKIHKNRNDIHLIQAFSCSGGGVHFIE